MKKNIIIIMVLGLLCFASAYAQTVNTTYNITGYKLEGNSMALLNKKSTKDVVLGAIATDTSQPYYATDYVLLKVDSNGSVLMNKKRDTTIGLERITETYDSGVIIASCTYTELIVRKYDNNLNLVWSYYIPVPYTVGGALNYYGSVDIEKTMQITQGVEPFPQDPEHPNDPPLDPNTTPTENYYIIYSSCPNDPSYNQDLGITVVRLNKDGGLVWHKIYTDANRANVNGTVQDKGNSITSFPDPNDPTKPLLALAGQRLVYDPFQSEKLWFMVIDDQGSIVSQYKTVNPTGSSAELYLPDILYDGDSLVATYTQEAYNFPDPTVPSAFGIMKFDIGLNSFRNRCFYDDCENIPTSITMSSYDSVDNRILYTGTDKDYLISGWTGKCYTDFTQPESNPCYLKLDKITLEPMQFVRYNKFTDVRNSSFHRTDSNDFNYMLPSVHWYLTPAVPIPITTAAYGVRYIKTDPQLQACGVWDKAVNYVDLELTTEDYEYEDMGYNQRPNFSTNEITLSVADKACNSASADYYRPTSVNYTAASNGFGVQVNPTVVNSKSETIICNVYSPMATSVDIAMYNVMGQIVYKNTYYIHAGNNNIRLSASALSTGLNMVRVMNGKVVLNTTKVNVLD